MAEITLVGYGNQGRAWAQNLRDSGWVVKVSGRERTDGGKGSLQAVEDGFAIILAQKLKLEKTPIALLLPDEAIPTFYERYFGQQNREPQQFIFAHGFSVVFGGMKFHPQDDVILMAPKGIAKKMRENFVAGSGVMGVLAVKQDGSGKAWSLANSVGEGLGCARVGLIKSTFEGETFVDLMSEQVLLCGGVPRLMDACVRFLIAKGMDPQLVVYECVQELKLIVDMIVEKGLAGMFANVSQAAKFGGLKAGEILLPEQQLQLHLQELWTRIESGSMARELFADRSDGYPILKKQLQQYEKHPVDQFL